MAFVSLITDKAVAPKMGILIESFAIPVLHPLDMALNGYTKGENNTLIQSEGLSDVLMDIISSEDWEDIVVFYDATFGNHHDC